MINPFWIIVLVVVGINLFKRFAEQSKEAQGGTPQRKQYPPLREGGAPTPVTRPPLQQQRQVDRERVPPVPGVGTRGQEYTPARPARAVTPGQQIQKMQREFERWFEEEEAEKGQVLWEASEEDAQEFFSRQRKPVPVASPPLIVEEVKTTVEPTPRAPIRPTVEAPRVVKPRAVPRRRAPVREMKRPVPVELPPGVLQNMDDVRRGIVMSEILGPPVSMR